MKITICDICEGDHKTEVAKYRLSMKGNDEKALFHVCENHKDYFADCKTAAAMNTKYLTDVEKWRAPKNVTVETY